MPRLAAARSRGEGHVSYEGLELMQAKESRPARGDGGSMGCQLRGTGAACTLIRLMHSRHTAAKHCQFKKHGLQGLRESGVLGSRPSQEHGNAVL